MAKKLSLYSASGGNAIAATHCAIIKIEAIDGPKNKKLNLNADDAQIRFFIAISYEATFMVRFFGGNTFIN